MSVSLLEVLENAGYDIKNNIDDAYWFQNLEEEFEELKEEANKLTDDWEDYKYWREEIEDTEGEYKNYPDFETWRKERE